MITQQMIVYQYIYKGNLLLVRAANAALCNLQAYIMICVACQASKRNTEGLIMASRGIYMPPHGGALKNANAFVLADVIMSVDTSRRLYDHSAVHCLPVYSSG